MADDGDESGEAARPERAPADGPAEVGEDPTGEQEDRSRQVESEHDFEEFGPAEMAEMSSREWEAAFDPDSWVTGPGLLDRLEADLAARVARRDVFAVVEREPDPDGPGERVVAYSDEGYAVVAEDGTITGRGTVLRDVKPSLALCSMPDYEVPDAPDDAGLPDPETVPESSGDLGNTLLQTVGVVQLLAGAVLFAAWITVPLSIVAAVVSLGFVAVGVFLLVVVANARLSDRFRAEEYRERLRDVGVESGERPAFVPGPGESLHGGDGAPSAAGGDGGADAGGGQAAAHERDDAPDR